MKLKDCTTHESDPRIGVVLLTSSLERGGAERQVVELANALDPSAFRVHVVSLSTDNPLAADLHDAERRLIVLPKRRKYDLSLIAKAARLLAKLNTSVVHSFLFDAEIVGRLAGRLARVPAVICSNRCPHKGRSGFKLWISRATEPCFDTMIANSWAGLEFERDVQRVDPAKLCVVPNGINTQRFQPGIDARLRAELNIPQDATVIGMLAHFRGNKDHETLIHAATKVLAARKDAWFVLAGGAEGAGNERIRQRCIEIVQRSGTGDRIIFAGPRSDVSSFYHAIDVKVLSTRFEGTPNVVLEAMASGLPVIATDVCDNGRIVVDGITGYIVPPNDANTMADRLHGIIEDKTLRKEMGAAGRLRVEQEYATSTLARRTANVYLSVLHEKGFHRGCNPLRPIGGEA